VNIFIQDNLYKAHFNQIGDSTINWVTYDKAQLPTELYQLNIQSDLVVATDEYEYLQELKKIKKKILVTHHSTVSFDLVNVGFNLIIQESDFEAQFVSYLSKEDFLKQNQIRITDNRFLMKDLALNEHEIQSLKNELNEKKEILEQLKYEEKYKRAREKKLNHILDFLNLNHGQNDFVENLCEILWKEVKKQGSFLSLGFYISVNDQENILITYNREAATFFYDVKLSFDDLLSTTKNIERLLNRPLGFLFSWGSTKFQKSSYLFLESKISKPDLLEIDSYFVEIVDLVVLMLQRFHVQQQVNNLMNKWNMFAEAYSQPLHVVDQEFNIVKSNYFIHENENIKLKCYQALASRNSPCDQCPVLKLTNTDQLKNEEKTTEYVSFLDKKFKANAVSFFSDKKYYFSFYEDQYENDQLRSQVILNEKMNVIGQLANHLAHELNNPLTGLKLTTEYLLEHDSVKNTTIQSDFLEILKGIDRSRNIIFDLLHFSSDQQSQLSEVMIEDVIKKTLPLLKTMTRTHNIFLDVKRIPVKMSVNQVQQVIFNLIKNACQAMTEKGFIKIYDVVSAEYYDVYFEDTGPGIPDTMRSQLFNAFTTSKQQGEGTGLGLFLSKKIMNRMGADLLHDEQYKNGARFILRFKKS